MSRRALASPAPGLLIRSARLVAALGALALASTGEMEMPVIVAFLVLFLAGLRIAGRPRLSRAMTILQPYLAVALFLVAIFDFFRVSQSFLLAVAHFLIGLQAIRLLALQTTRENLGSVLVSSLMMLSAATLAIDWTFFVMLILFLPSAVWTLMLHTVVLESQDGWDRDKGQVALGEGTPAWRELARALRRSAAAAFGVTAVCCAVVFAAFPRFNLQGFRGQFLQPVNKTGFTNQVDLNKAGRIFTDDSVVMRIEVAPEERGYWTGYVRGTALDEFDGRTWRKAPRQPERVYPVRRGEFRIAHSASEKKLHQSVYLESMDTPVLFGVPRIIEVRIDRPFLEVSPDGAVQRPNGDAWRIHYDVTSIAGPLANRGLTVLSPMEYNLTTSVPTHVDSARRLAAEKGGKGTPTQVAERLARFLSTTYKYSLTLAPTEGRHPIDNFLEHSRAGHCEYFASSLCLMLRYRGIPSRMVTGFLTREWNEQGHYFVARMRDAHAWVEYFDPARGWVEIDPSPRAVSGPSTGESPLQRKAKEAWDYLNLRWNRYILSYDIDRQVAIIRTVTRNSGRLSLRLERTVIDVRRWLRVDAWSTLRAARKSGEALSFNPRLLVAPVGIAIVMGGLYFLLRGRRSDRVWFHKRLVRRLEALGAAAGPDRTLRELAAEAAPRLRDHATDLHFLENEYYRIRFDPASQLTRAARRRIRRSLAAIGA